MGSEIESPALALVHELVALGLLFFFAVIGGLAARQLRLPPLLGMLLAGLALNNAPGDPLRDLPDNWSVTLRLLALTVILLRAGLGLDLNALYRLRGNFLRLAFIPNLTEAATVAIAAKILLDLPVVWSLLLGFVISAVSPAVVVPSMLDLQSEGYGVAKGIPTMVLAAASFDDVLSITGFGAMLSLVFAGQGDASLTESLLRAPIELLLGLGAGVLTGAFCAAIVNAPAWLRFGALLSFGFLAIFGGWAVGLTGGGSLATMTMAAVAARGWPGVSMPVAKALGRLWSVAQPILFGLIGAAITVSAVEPTYISRGLIILAIGLMVRLLATYVSIAPSQFTTRERLFIALAWIPKATVQAAIGALALDLAKEYEAGIQAETYGTQVVTIAVLSIILTAPVGALAIASTGPRWLQRQDETT